MATLILPAVEDLRAVVEDVMPLAVKKGEYVVIDEVVRALTQIMEICEEVQHTPVERVVAYMLGMFVVPDDICVEFDTHH